MPDDEPDGARTGLRAAAVGRTRRQIVAAARRHVIESGYHRLGLEQVAADAGVTRVTIYRQFGSKLGLLDAVAEGLAQRSELVSRMGVATEIPDPSSAFRAMVAELCRFWGADPDLLRRLISLAAVDPEAEQVIADREDWRYRQVGAVVARLDEAGRLRPGVGRAQAVAVVGAVTGFPTCDEIARRLHLEHADLDPTLLVLLAGVVHLDRPGE